MYISRSIDKHHLWQKRIFSENIIWKWAFKNGGTVTSGSSTSFGWYFFFTFFSSTIIMYVCQWQYVKSFSCDNATVVSGHGLWTYIGAYWALDRREGGREGGGAPCLTRIYNNFRCFHCRKLKYMPLCAILYTNVKMGLQ